jgi:ABC-type multidrug transport system ATPase subunit
MERSPVDVVLNETSIHVVQKSPLSIFSSSSADIRKALVQPLSIRIAGGSLFAILGGSGSGKTTLLNVIAQRYDRNSIEVGGGGISFSTPTKTLKHCKIGYVTQGDYLLPFLTVKETISFAARLKVARDVNGQAPALDEIVANIILELGLSECANTRIGDDASSAGLGMRRGISGGEKRRVSMALQIVANPEGE